MWLTDHQMNMRLAASFGQAADRLPLKKAATIIHGNALKIDWETVISSHRLSYMLGNPPFVGKHLMSTKQSEELAIVFHGITSVGVLDYVTAWYWKAAHYIQGTRIKVAFVSTNSITQGEQAAVLWQPMLSRYGIHIHFAHRTFKWTIDEKRAKGMMLAAVYCVIIGFGQHDATAKALYDYEKPISAPIRIEAKNINPYLVDAPNIVINRRGKPLCNVPEMNFGSKPVDDGHLLFTEAEKNALLLQEPQAAPFFRPILSAKEFLNGEERWCLWLQDADSALLRKCPLLMQRVEQVKSFRLASKKAPTREAAKTPTLFAEIRQPNTSYILIPRHSSEHRRYVPLGFFAPDYIVSDSCSCIPDATIYHFGVLTSAMHMGWMRQVCGRIKSDYRYSNTLVYNNFPWPNPTPAQMKTIEDKAQAVLDVRAQFPSNSLADLYDPLVMPPALVKAHHALDKAVDAAYRKATFTSEREQVEFLFGEYQKLTAPLIAPLLKKQRSRKLKA